MCHNIVSCQSKVLAEAGSQSQKA